MRLCPPDESEWTIAHHEAAHAVLSTLFEFPYPPASVSIWEHPDGLAWAGNLQHGKGQREWLPDFFVTTPHQWRLAVIDGWTSLLIGYAGSAAVLRLLGKPYTAEDIRHEPSGAGDEAEAIKVAAHFWPEGHRGEVLDAAADFAGILMQVPIVWAAVQAVAAYLIDIARHRIATAELETIVRKHLPATIPAPDAEWAQVLAED